MDLTRDELEDFRQDVRAFIAGAFDEVMRQEAARQSGLFAEEPLARRWQHALHSRGWVAPHWPAEYGGPGWSAEQCRIFAAECARAGTPAIPEMGLSLCGPLIMQYGTAAQKQYFLPRILSGEHWWCQGFSEPGAGSDLAALKTRARRDGDDYIVDGSKIWTTYAQDANWIFTLVRTADMADRRQGISFLLIPMDSPGISIGPILSMSGDHELNQVFFDGVSVPAANLVAEENAGWEAAKYLLKFERSIASLGVLPLLFAMEDATRAAAVAPSGHGGALLDEPTFGRKLATREVALVAADAAYRHLDLAPNSSDTEWSKSASIRKLLSSHRAQDMTELSIDLAGPYAIVDQRDALGIAATRQAIGPEQARTAMARYLNLRAATIFGGSAEIQHEIIARALEL
ncbi:acyl-CoA dehydrogenase family protein [Sphingomonas sp. SRS2]|uniref:acyl-CoA dehydrogenase family protein n=1 Tax=Sphingomonas sp. SRS2 TaxID=133190 RepID=UPI00190FE064|nr:acyl-CoA dehydrogenase family protein [Sphingomonas sp. SRS2]